MVERREPFQPDAPPPGCAGKRADGLKVYNVIYETEFMD